MCRFGGSYTRLSQRTSHIDGRRGRSTQSCVVTTNSAFWEDCSTHGIAIALYEQFGELKKLIEVPIPRGSHGATVRDVVPSAQEFSKWGNV